MPKRRGQELFKIEREVLDAAHRFALAGNPQFHGYQAMQEIRRVSPDHSRIGHGAIYRALDRLNDLGLLDSEWEDPTVSLREGRPRRCLYRLTPIGARSRSRVFENVSGDSAVRKKSVPAGETLQ
jgi:DNA-binding PadR family transcriptional regulator